MYLEFRQIRAISLLLLHRTQAGGAVPKCRAGAFHRNRKPKKENPMVHRKLNVRLLPLWLLCSTIAANAQQRGMASITAEDLRTHLSFIAADELEGRDTPSTGDNIATRYLATVVERFGFKPLMPDGSFFQHLPLEVTEVSRSRSRLRVLAPAGEEIFYFPESFGGNFRSTGTWSGDVVFVGYGISAPDRGWDDYGDEELEGKIVVMLDAQLPEGHPLRAERALLGTRTSIPRSRGAAAVLSVIHPDREKDLLSPGSGFQASRRTVMTSRYPTQTQARISASPAKPQAAKPQPAARRALPPGQAEIRIEAAARILDVSRAEVEAMFAAIAAGRQVPHRALDKRVELSVVTETRPATSPNVLAMLEGSDPVLKDEFIVISSHHDHLGMRNGRPMDGADDNGSGTVGMLEIAEALAMERPKRSVLLAWFTGEEKGLFGSHYFVNNCPVPLEKISADLNLDMISRNDPDGLYLIASDNLSTALDGTIREVNDRLFKIKFDYEYNDRAHRDRFYYRSDHYPFLRVGIPAVWLFSGTTPDYHQTTDTIDRVDFLKMEKITRLTYMVTYQIGNLPELLKLDANPEVTTRGKHNTAVESIR
jgi:hypothetical protein